MDKEEIKVKVVIGKGDTRSIEVRCEDIDPDVLGEAITNRTLLKSRRVANEGDLVVKALQLLLETSSAKTAQLPTIRKDGCATLVISLPFK